MSPRSAPCRSRDENGRDRKAWGRGHRGPALFVEEQRPATVTSPRGRPGSAGAAATFDPEAPPLPDPRLEVANPVRGPGLGRVGAGRP